MLATVLADLIVIPLVIILVARFGHRQQEPEWLQLSRMRAYMRSPEFIKKHEKLIETYLKGGADCE